MTQLKLHDERMTHEVDELMRTWGISYGRLVRVVTQLLARGYVEVREVSEVPMVADICRRLLRGRVVYQRRMRRVALLRG